MNDLEQSADVGRPAEFPLETRLSNILPGPRLQLSVEHAAIALMLEHEEFELVLMLGAGMSQRDIGRELMLPSSTVNGRVGRLKSKTRMSHLGLAVLGYQLMGQVDGALRPAA